MLPCAQCSRTHPCLLPLLPFLTCIVLQCRVGLTVSTGASLGVCLLAGAYWLRLSHQAPAWVLWGSMHALWFLALCSLLA